MKHLFIAFSFMACLFATTSFANDTKTNPVILQSFYQTFTGATNVSATEVDGMTRISFTIDEETRYAYYNVSGDLLVVTKQLSISQLPKALQADLKKNYGSFFVSDVYEFTTDEKTEYYVVLDNGGDHLVLSSVSSKWKIFTESHKK
jgi:hypothetical protein